MTDDKYKYFWAMTRTGAKLHFRAAGDPPNTVCGKLRSYRGAHGMPVKPHGIIYRLRRFELCLKCFTQVLDLHNEA